MAPEQQGTVQEVIQTLANAMPDDAAHDLAGVLRQHEGPISQLAINAAYDYRNPRMTAYLLCVASDSEIDPEQKRRVLETSLLKALEEPVADQDQQELFHDQLRKLRR